MPTVFISYSQDSSDHKRWVAQLGADLFKHGVTAILDQWDLSFGSDVTLFMEKGIEQADKVLCICTDGYIRKAEAGEGGVGYERLIITAELVREIHRDIFIPVIRNSNPEKRTPRFLATRFYVDLSDGVDYREELEKLVRNLHGLPAVDKPALGEPPFGPREPIQEEVEQ
jgi:hypothetical protein